MKVEDINFNNLKQKYTKISIGNCDKWYVGLIDEVLTQFPEDWKNKEVKEIKEFFNSWIVELEKEN